MSANIFGERLKMISFGESHGPAYGIVIDGLPAGVYFDKQILLNELARRKPGQNQFVTARQESDVPEILSGVFEEKTLGTPLAIVVRNQDQRSVDYSEIKNNPRIGHADDTWMNKFGHVDHRGGGRSSGRETINRVMAGAVAQMFVRQVNDQVQIQAGPIQIGSMTLSGQMNQAVEDMLIQARQTGESYGGIVECRLKNIPVGLGQPIFHKFKSDLSQAMMSLGAVTGFEFGSGFSKVDMKGTDYHQSMQSENYGGIRGGITTGDDLIFRVAFKPTSSIKDTAKKGRHDPCIIPRAIPVIEAMCWFVVADHLLWQRTDRV